MIRTLLIANRGEVAGRIIATCRRMGIRSVAVYSDADRESLYVRRADSACYLGPSPASDSYLNIEALVKAAKRSGADGVHPGYGFLAENAEFARGVSDAGLVFVGPAADVIEQMGSKVRARALCREAGVPTVPGSEALDDEGLLAWAEEHGYPVMLKASAGGGGKGMRLIPDSPALKSALPSARREAEKAFGSDQLYLEKAVERARHLEVQVVGDGTRVLHLGVRECSLQRRHQKIIEESPPAHVTPELMRRLTSAAVKLAQSVNYASLGTVEFLVEDENFYFLEMNTRLQVEHPVTEMITGIDLVELQLNLAQGMGLPFTQTEVEYRGHAVEARIACEDPYHGFLPATGRVLDWRPCLRIRCDSTLEPGAEVSPHYDSMVAKAIAWGETRAKALRLLESALQDTVLLGVRSNIDFLVSLLRVDDVLEGRQTTRLVESLDLSPVPPSRRQLLAAAAFRWVETAAPEQRSTFPVVFEFEEHPPVIIQGSRYTVEETVYQIRLHRGALEVDGYRFGVVGARRGQEWWIHTPEGTCCFKGVPRLPVPGKVGAADGSLVAPMPGSVVEVLVKEGDRVELGQTLLKLEAMKMEQVISSPYDGVVEKVLCEAGDQVAAGSVLVVVAAS